MVDLNLPAQFRIVPALGGGFRLAVVQEDVQQVDSQQGEDGLGRPGSVTATA